MHILDRWELDEVKRKAENAEQRLYKLDSIGRDVDSLECTVRQLSAALDGIRAEFEAYREATEEALRKVTQHDE